MLQQPTQTAHRQHFEAILELYVKCTNLKGERHILVNQQIRVHFKHMGETLLPYITESVAIN